MVPQPSVVPEQSMVPGPEVTPIPVSDDLVIEILIDQMIDFGESSTDVLEIFAVTGGDQKRDDVNERKMTGGEDLSQSKGGRVAVVAGSQSLRRCEQEGC